MQHRPDPRPPYAQVRYANTSQPPTATFPAGSDLFASLSDVDSIARNFLQAAVVTLSLVLFILWLARLLVSWLERRHLSRLARHWDSLPQYAEALEQSEKFKQQRTHCCSHVEEGDTAANEMAETVAEECTCTICFSTAVAHPVELLPCGHHQFCAQCLVQLWEYSGVHHLLTCPLCRHTVTLVCPVRLGDVQPSMDDVLLLKKYNGGFCGARRHTFLDQWVLRLRAMTNARLLPIVIGLRIVVLHATVFTYMLLPENEEPQKAAASPSDDANSNVSGSVLAAVRATVVHCTRALLCTTVAYADDLFVVSLCIILTGSLLQKALFTDLKL